MSGDEKHGHYRSTAGAHSDAPTIGQRCDLLVADAIDPIVSGLYLYVATGSLNTVERITTTTDQILSVAVGSEDVRLVMNPAGTVLYVLNTNSYTISVINLSNFTVTATIKGFQFPRAIAINATGSNTGTIVGGHGGDVLHMFSAVRPRGPGDSV